MSRGVLLLALLSAVCFGAIVRVALAGDNYHVACVEHGFYSGGNNSDNSFFSRVYAGCGSSDRYCGIMDRSTEVGADEVLTSTGTCNSWSEDFGNFTECTAGANVSDPGVFALHQHLSAGGC
jgi:hypothetical protein